MFTILHVKNNEVFFSVLNVIFSIISISSQGVIRSCVENIRDHFDIFFPTASTSCD